MKQITSTAEWIKDHVRLGTNARDAWYAAIDDDGSLLACGACRIVMAAETIVVTGVPAYIGSFRYDPEKSDVAPVFSIDTVTAYLLHTREELIDFASTASDGEIETLLKQTEYTVCFLFDPSLEYVLLQTKAKTDFKGKLNGVGGKVEADESPDACAYREITEETGVRRADKLTWIGTLSLPDNCDNHRESIDPSDPACVLYYYAGIVQPDLVKPPEGAERLEFVPVNKVLAAPVTDDLYAGNGDLQYFVKRGTAILTQILGPRLHHE